MKVTPYVSAARYIRCPTCDHEFRVDHLGSQAGSSFGPWSCDTDGCQSIVGTFDAAGDIELEIVPSMFERALHLLHGQGLWLVVEGLREPDGTAPHAEYHYGEHTCPENVFRSVVAVFTEDGEADPHGLFLPVAHVACTAERLKKLENAEFDETRALFGMSAAAQGEN